MWDRHSCLPFLLLLTEVLRHFSITFATLLAFSASLSAGTPAENLINNPDSWFRSEVGRITMGCILSWQTEHGGLAQKHRHPVLNNSGNRLAKWRLAVSTEISHESRAEENIEY